MAARHLTRERGDHMCFHHVFHVAQGGIVVVERL